MDSSALFVFPSSAWVKNVYILGMSRNKWGINLGKLYTDIQPYLHKYLFVRVKHPFYTHSINTFTPYLFTVVFSLLYLLHTYLYSVSTPPTITKTKEKKERNS